MSKMLPTFEVDKDGLAKQLARKGKHFAVAELIQNAWDENVENVAVTLEWQEHDPDANTEVYMLEVSDDSPEGFADLTHAYTLFAESKKKDDPEKRGRFNLGEKLVIALCESCVIETTKGTVRFTEKGREVDHKTYTDAGSNFRGMVKLTKDEAAEVERVVFHLIPPQGVTTTFNNKALGHRVPLATFEIPLKTERADGEGYLRPTTRKTTVSVYEPKGDEVGSLYELGIPVVETGDTYHVDVGQKVPINTDRDNVPPSYLRDVRVAVLNEMHKALDSEAISEPWIDNAMEDEDVSQEAVQSVVTGRYGDKVVGADPSDREAEKIAVSQGYQVVPAGAFSKGAWGNVKGAGAVLPAGQVTPSPDPSAGEDVLNLMERDHWPEPVERFARFCAALALETLGIEDLTVRIAQPKKAGEWPYNATWGRRGPKRAELTFNYTTLGYAFFEFVEGLPSERALALINHEFAHHHAPEHLSREFYDWCCKVGAKVTRVLADPVLREQIMTKVEVEVATA